MEQIVPSLWGVSAPRYLLWVDRVGHLFAGSCEGVPLLFTENDCLQCSNKFFFRDIEEFSEILKHDALLSRTIIVVDFFSLIWIYLTYP